MFPNMRMASSRVSPRVVIRGWTRCGGKATAGTKFLVELPLVETEPSATKHMFDITDTSRAALSALRRDLHANPELSFQETRTAEVVATRLHRAGLAVRTGLARTGVVGVLRGGRPGKVVMVRADIDALPIHEESEAPYRSRQPGVMHACGHDGHTAVAVILAEGMAGRRADLPGTLVFAFQPAEEIAQGALPMIQEGVMDQPRVDAVVGFHLLNGVPAGVVHLRAGLAMASMDEIGITIDGLGGHGAVPHRAVDPIVAAAHVVAALQTVVSRETSPLDAVVVTIGTIQGGTAFNIIPDRVEMRGTVRAFTEQSRERTLRRIEEIATATAAAHRARATVTHRFGCPPVVNDPGVTAIVRQVAVQVVGPERVREAEMWTASDDMAYFLRRAPGCYFMVGSQNADRGLDAPHHNARFDFDEEALVVATQVLGGAALRLLE